MSSSSGREAPSAGLRTGIVEPEVASTDEPHLTLTQI